MFVDRYFDCICIAFGLTSIILGVLFYKDWEYLIAVGVGGMLTIISGSNFLNPHCRDKLLHGIGLDDGNSKGLRS